jgi:hypothetical protein
MEIRATVIAIGETQQVTEKFKKRDLVVEYAENEKYPEQVKFEANQSACDKLDELRAGDDITVHFNLRGRAWKDKNGVNQYFNTLNVWKFDLHQTSANPSKMQEVAFDDSGSDSLPF